VDSSIGKVSGLGQITDDSLLADYNALQTEIVNILNTWTSLDLTTLNTKQSEVNERKNSLDKRRDLLFPKTDTLTAGDAATITAKRTAERVLDFFFWIAAIFGGIINSHIFLTRPTLMRLYYWVFGFALFPVVLLYALYDPPAWRAALFPWFDRGSVPPVFNSFLLKPVTTLVMFRQPVAGETDFGGITRSMLRFISMGLLAGIVVLYYMIRGVLPIPTL
jgi:lipid-A-disaccharide synthase-like uncharacterized protein